MSLRCSVLGHDFGESEVEREQERQGSEVVVTVRESETCRRCGETKLISENTNVTAVQNTVADDEDDGDDGVTADEPFSSDRGAPSAPDGASSGTGTGGNALTPPSDGEDDAEILGDDDRVDPTGADEPGLEAGADDDLVVPGEDDVGDAGDGADDDEAFAPSGPDQGDGAEVDPDAGDEPPEPADDITFPEEEVPEGDEGEDAAEIVEAEEGTAPDDDVGHPDDAEEPVTDDGVILDETEEPTERGHGEWPESDAKHPAEAEGDTPDSPVAWPESEDEDEGYDATVGDVEDVEDVDLDGSLTPDAPADAGADVEPESVDEDGPAEGHDAEFIGSPDRGPEASSAAEEEVGSGITRSASARVPDGSTPVDRPTEFYCPRCDHVVPASRSSLRAGDICPECSMGYLAERER